MLWRRMGEPVGPLTTDQKLDRLADVVGGLARQQQQQLQATRYTGLLASLKQVEWAAPELRCFAARLLVLATLAEGDDPAAAFALVKALIGIFQAEIATINDRLVRDGKVPWAEVERELNQILKRAAPDAVDTVMQLVHMTADEAKGSAETKRKRGREDDDMEERCTWHPNAKDRHTNSECKAQKSAASANAKALARPSVRARPAHRRPPDCIRIPAARRRRSGSSGDRPASGSGTDACRSAVPAVRPLRRTACAVPDLWTPPFTFRGVLGALASAGSGAGSCCGPCSSSTL